MADPQTARPILPYTFAKENGFLVGDNDFEDRLIVYYKDLPTIQCFQEVKRFLQCDLLFRELDSKNFDERFLKTYKKDSSVAMQAAEMFGEDIGLKELSEELLNSQDLYDEGNDAPVIQFLNAILTDAIKEKASDVHIETYKEEFILRFRVDGLLREVLKPQKILAPMLISRIKIMAMLDIAEKRLPQDGHINLKIYGKDVDVRISTIPTNHGERIVLRLLDKQVVQLNLKHLGMEERTLKMVNKLIHMPHGIFLVTGPTGAGKSTSLYAMLTEINKPSNNILTVEDPIEYDLAGIGQTQVNPKIDMTFAKALRAILRQDPDVVMIGEIRDVETAKIAIQASLTGHLVFSTLHTNTAIGAITRLQDMSIEPFLLATSVIGVLAQRLVLLLCEACKQSRNATEEEKRILECKDSKESLVLYQPVGCAMCHGVGFSGRTGIYELIVIDEKLRGMIHEKASEQKMNMYALSLGTSMLENGFRLVKQGHTTLEEVLHVTTES